MRSMMELEGPPAEKVTPMKEHHGYRGIRMRKWGKWVAEIREPNKRSRIWLGSYCTPVAAAKAYDTALLYLRGRAARLNFPEDVYDDDVADVAAMSAASIRKRAAEVGAKVDSLQLSTAAVAAPLGERKESRGCQKGEKRRYKSPDLNQELKSEPEGDDDEEQSGGS